MFTRDKLPFGYGVKTGGNNTNWWNPNIVNDNWFDPITTNEGLISNVTLIYNAMSSNTLTHEILHLYGLTDLYGSDNSPANSLMSDNTVALLALEKWTLGWLEDENVQCVSEKVDIKNDSANNSFNVDISVQDQLLVVPTGATTALFIDVIKRSDRKLLSFYSMDNDIRPAITAYRSNSRARSIEVTNNLGIASYIESPKYTLLIKDNIAGKLSISLIPNDLVKSDAGKQLFSDAENNQTSSLKLAQAEKEAKAAAELKAKQEAEAKVAAVKKTTITCVKGKLTKKVTSVKPKCPGGYKLKK